jgi:hypothetical protein
VLCRELSRYGGVCPHLYPSRLGEPPLLCCAQRHLPRLLQVAQRLVGQGGCRLVKGTVFQDFGRYVY